MLKKLLIGVSSLALSGTAYAANQTTTTQTGTGNNLTTSQSAATNGVIVIEQVGTSNSTTATQGGTGDFTKIRVQGTSNQANSGATGNNNASLIFQGLTLINSNPPVNVSNNSATVTQSSPGANNFSYISQQADGNVAIVAQSGNGMNGGSATDPVNGPFGASGPSYSSDVEQYGTRGYANVNQAGDAQIVEVYQGVKYDSTAAGSKPGSHITVVEGIYNGSDSNSATVIQYGGATHAQAFVYQGETDNVANVSQAGTSQYADIRQSTDRNLAIAGEGNNSATITQDTSASSAIAYIFQQGVSNSATVHQTTAGANADVRQYGTQNVAHVTQ